MRIDLLILKYFTLIYEIITDKEIVTWEEIMEDEK